jgi:hypothetical protein
MLLVLPLVSKGGTPAPVAAQVGTVPGCNLNLPLSLSHGDSDGLGPSDSESVTGTGTRAARHGDRGWLGSGTVGTPARAVTGSHGGNAGSTRPQLRVGSWATRSLSAGEPQLRVPGPRPPGRPRRRRGGGGQKASEPKEPEVLERASALEPGRRPAGRGRVQRD